MIERQIDIDTGQGAMGCFIDIRAREGPFPVVLFFMDAPAIREELRDMARRIATVGYYVMLPNLYYRSRVNELAGVARETMMALMESLTIAKVMDDAAVLIAFANADPAAADGPIGAIGYCMSGQFAVNAAARWPQRIAAAASLYGVRLVTEAPDKSTQGSRQGQRRALFACAETDAWAPLTMVELLAETLEADGVNAEVEVYPGVQHGFAFPQRAVYDKPAAERHWERLFALFRRRLGR